MALFKKRWIPSSVLLLLGSLPKQTSTVQAPLEDVILGNMSTSAVPLSSLQTDQSVSWSQSFTLVTSHGNGSSHVPEVGRLEARKARAGQRMTVVQEDSNDYFDRGWPSSLFLIADSMRYASLDTESKSKRMTHFALLPCGNDTTRHIFLRKYFYLNPNDPCMGGTEIMVWFAGSALLALLVGIIILWGLLWNAASSSIPEVDQDDTSDEISAMASRLASAKHRGYVARLKLSGPAVVFGVTLLVFGVPTTILYAPVGNFSLLRYFRNIAWLGINLCVFALLPTDSAAIKAICLGTVFLFLWLSLSDFRLASWSPSAEYMKTWYNFDDKMQAFFLTYRSCSHLVLGLLKVALGVNVVFILWSSTLRSVLERTRICVGVIQVAAVFDTIVILSFLRSYSRDWPPQSRYSYYFAVTMNVMNAILCFNESLRIRIREMLTSNSEQAMTAAGVSQLLSHSDPAEIVARARASFTCVPADRLTREDMADNVPNPKLQALAEPAKLGEVDVFLSHSWHDDPEAKWNSIQSWREAFKLDNGGKEPMFWIDKYCINQDNITDSLSCLPVWLAGCKKVVAFVGDTYLQRLWCVMEIFVFVQMGLSSDNFSMVMTSDLESFRAAIQTYDISQAKCFTPEDTERLMRIIDAAGAGVSSTITKFVKSKFDGLEAPSEIRHSS